MFSESNSYEYLDFLSSQPPRLVHTLNSHQSSGAFHKDVGQELKARLHYATKKDFFAHIFPNITEDVLNSIEKRNTVQETLRELEKLAKDSNTLEKYYYPHIVGLGNDIVSSLRKRHDGSTMHLDWIDCSNDTPSSSEAKDARIRTDVGLVIRSEASRKHLADIGEEMVRCKDEIDNLGKRDSENRTALENEYGELRTKFKKARHLFWTQFFVVSEIKRNNDDKSVNDSRVQVVTHCRMILQEQPDRLFVICFTLCKRQLRLFLVDRAGVLAADGFSDISQSEGRRDFLHVLTFLAQGDVEHLGWDTTMKLYKAQTPPAHLSKLTENDFIHSYQREFEWTSDTIRTDLWAVSMPSSSPSRDREWYVLPELLSGASIFAMSGRAAMIWKAVKLHDPSGKIYILKQSWRVIEDETNLESGNIDILSTVNNHRNIHEGRLWKLGLQDTELESFEDVRIGNKNVTIASYCRKGLEYIPHQVPSSRQSETHSEGNDKSRPLDLPTPDHRQHDQSPIPVQNRSLSRTCLRSPGIPIRMFTTVAELLKFFRDAIQQHKDLYMAGVLHGDVSLGNLIICPKFDENTKTYTWENAQGKLIDLDHAKYTQKWKTLTPNDTSASGYKERWERMAGALRVTLVDEPHFQYLDIESMSERAYAWYVGRVANDYATLQAMTLSPALELQLDLGRRPNFEPNSLDKSDSHTGTYPFMSCELLSPSNAYAEARDGMKPVVHHAVHDLESFMACLLYLIITRQGGGGMRREELDDANSQVVPWVFNLFTEKNRLILSGNKKTFLVNSVHRSIEHVHALPLRHVHPTFEKVKSLVYQWAQVLHIAYSYQQSWEYHCIHDIVLHLIDKTLQDVESDPNSPKIPGYDLAMEYRRKFSVFTGEVQDTEASFMRTPEKNDRTKHGLSPEKDKEAERARDFRAPGASASASASGSGDGKAQKKLRTDA